MNRFFSLCVVGVLLSSLLCAQQQLENTRAKSTDWEEVNFETNQAVIVDGFPSLLRLADLLKAHQDFKVNIVGHADSTGSTNTNNALSLRRANAVSQFLQKYGAAAGQLQTSGEGSRSPEQTGNDRNSRFVNRRVVITVNGPDGRTVGDGTISSAIDEFNTYVRAQLGKLDNMSSQIQQLQTQVGTLNTGDIKQDTTQIRQDTSAIKQDTAAIKQDTGTLVQRPVPLTSEQTTKIAQDAADYALTQSALRNRKYTLLGFDAGPTMGPGRIGDFSADVFGKALIPFGNGKTQEQPGTHGFQVDASWVYAHQEPRRNSLNAASGTSDGIFNAGLVNRFGIVQVGTFAQFDYASIYLNQFRADGTQIFSRGGGLLGGGVLTLNLVMPGATIGVFGAKGFKDSSNLTTNGPAPLTAARYLRYTDQAGVSGAGTFRKFQIEASIAFVKRYTPGWDQQPAGTLKVSFGQTDTMQFYAEGSNNTTLNGFNYGYRAVIGIQFGNWVRARNYGSTSSVIPVNLPRPHYELLAR